MNKNLRMIVSFVGNDKLSGSLRSIIGLGQTGSQKLALMKRAARDLEGELRGVQRELRSSTGNVTDLMGREADLERRIARTNREMERQVGLLAASNRGANIRGKGDALKSSGQGNVAGGVGIGASLFLAAKGGMEFQSGMTDIALKANLSAKQTAIMQTNILNAARAARQLPESMRAGVDVLSGFGMTPQQAERMIGPIGKVATTYRAEIADLSAAAFANFQNLKVPISENARALEIMASAGNAGAFEIKDMAQFFPSLTAQAQAFGQKGVGAVADLAAAAQIARKATGDSSSAANNLQNLMAKINTEDTIKKFAKFGIDLPAAMKKAYAQGKTPLEAIAELSNKAVGGDLSRLSFLFGDMQAQSALRPLIQNMDEYRRIRSEAMASKGAVDAAFARRSEDAAVQTTALIGNLQRLAITAGPVLLPVLVGISQTLITVTDRIGAWMQANPQAAATIVQLVAGLAAFKIGLGIVQIGLGGLLGPVGSVIGFAPRIAQAFGIVRTAALFLGRGIMQAGMLMLANPIVAAIVGIVAVLGIAGYMVYKHWDKIKAAFAAAGTWLAGLGGRFMTFGRAIMDGLVNGIASRINAIRSMITGIAGKVSGWFRNVLGIKSPSRVFMGLGGHITDGLAIGLQRGQGTALQAVRKLAGGVAGVSMAVGAPAMADIARPALPSAIGTLGLPKAVPFELPPLAPIQPRASAASGSGGGNGGRGFGGINVGGITIHAAPGQSPQDIAAVVEAKLREMAGQAAASARSAYIDD